MNEFARKVASELSQEPPRTRGREEREKALSDLDSDLRTLGSTKFQPLVADTSGEILVFYKIEFEIRDIRIKIAAKNDEIDSHTRDAKIRSKLKAEARSNPRHSDFKTI